jgi:hypothetical protein
MPPRREDPTKLKQTGYYFFDEYIGFPPDRKRIRRSFKPGSRSGTVLGHNKITTSLIYSHTEKEKKREAFNSLAEVGG